MSEYAENIISYVLGGIIGIAIGHIIFSFPASALLEKYDDTHSLLLVIAGLLGMLISAGFREYRKIKLIRHNTDLKDEIVTLITHEMRTGLTSTNWVIQFMLETYGEDFTKEDRERLSSVIHYTETTVMHSVNLLDISLLEIEKLSIHREKMRLSSVETAIKEVAEKYAFGTQRKGIQFVFTINLDNTKEAEIDIMRIRIVVENILENAIQYTDGDIKSLSLDVTNDAKKMNIVIRDTGMGIPQNEQNEIFAKFYRASNARKKLSSGSGIGLYMSKKYVEAHRGTIRFESQEHKGSTFFISLPLKTSQDIGEFLTKV